MELNKPIFNEEQILGSLFLDIVKFCAGFSILMDVFDNLLVLNLEPTKTTI